MSFKSPIDTLTSFETLSRTTDQPGTAAAVGPPARYAIRQALDQEFRKYRLLQSAEMRQARYTKGAGSGIPAGSPSSGVVVDELPADKTVITSAPTSLKPRRDFFGRIITIQQQQQQQQDDGVIRKSDGEIEIKGGMIKRGKCDVNNQVWVSFNEGFSNAVRKPITIEELMRGF